MNVMKTDTLLKQYYNPCDLDDVNRIRQMDEKSPLASLNGYCMSTGCSCRDHEGKKGLPICGLFKSYESDGVKRDFINQLFGI